LRIWRAAVIPEIPFPKMTIDFGEIFFCIRLS